MGGVPFLSLAGDDRRKRGPLQAADDSGAFRFAGVRAGSYRLIARQVGFRPFDTTVVKIDGAPLVVWISMEPLVIELAAPTGKAAVRSES